MICVNCEQGSMGSWCPFCGEPDIVRVLGFDPFDPLNLGFTPIDPLDLRHQVPDATGLPNADVNVKNPFAGITSPLDSLGGFFSVLKWVVIGGAVVGAVVLLYGAFRFIPVALGLAAGNAREVGKMAPQLLAKSLQ